MKGRDFLHILRDRWILIVATTLVGLALSILVTRLSAKVYQADAQIFITSNSTSDPLALSQAAIYTQTQVATFADIVASPEVLQNVRRDLNLDLTPAQLKSKITATAPAQRSLVDIHVTDSSPTRAAAIANSVSRAFVAQLEKYTTPTDSAKPSVVPFVTDPATAPGSPTSPNAVLNISLGVVLGFLLGLSAGALRQALDNRIRDAEVLARVAGAPMMGVIVEDSKTPRYPVATRAGQYCVRAENFRQLRANLQFANVDRHPRVIAVASSIPDEGKTTIAINLASTLAEAGFTVCLVDADLRRPTVAKILGLPGTAGLTSVLINQVDVDDVLQPVSSNLQVLSAGPTPPNPSEVLASAYVRDVVHSLLTRFDYVVVDTSPLLPVADGSEVAALADGTLLVARCNVATDSNVKRSVQTLTRVDAKVIGVVLNRAPGRRGGGEYAYSYRPGKPAAQREAATGDVDGVRTVQAAGVTDTVTAPSNGNGGDSSTGAITINGDDIDVEFTKIIERR